MIPYTPGNTAFIENPGASVGTAPDITAALTSALASKAAVVLDCGTAGARGFYKLDADAVSVSEAMGARHIAGLGGLSRQTTIALVGAGVGLGIEAEGSSVEGLEFINAAGGDAKNQTGVKFTKSRYFAVRDLRGYKLDAVAEFHGPSVYYWHLERSHASNCNVGFKFSPDLNGLGANRGMALNCVTYKCGIGYEVIDANTAQFVGCNSAADDIGVYVDARFVRWFGGSLEDSVVRPLEVATGAKDNLFIGYNSDNPSGVVDNGIRTVLEPANDWPWVTHA